MDPSVTGSACSWQERQSPATFNKSYPSSWTSTGTCTTLGQSFLTATGWMSEAETQTVSLYDLVQQVLTSMLQDYLQSHNVPLVASCPHTKAVDLDYIIQALANSHQAVCTQSNQYQSFQRDEVEQASWMILELSNTLTRTIQQQEVKPVQNSTPYANQQRKRPNRDEPGAAPERKKIKMIKAPKGIVYPCAKCGTTFGMQKDLIKHYNTVHSLTRPFKCNECDKWFKTNSECHKHTKMIHLNQYNYRCSICNIGASTRKKLEAHKLRHLEAKDKPLKCKHCGKGFVKDNELQVHLSTHEAVLKVQCELCKAQWSRYHHAYKKHMERVHRAYTREQSGVHKCLVCDKGYQNCPLLMDHMKANHSDLGVACQHCGRKFASKKEVEKHVENNHTQKIACNTCGQEFITEKGLRKHYRIKHSSSDKYEPQIVEFKGGKVGRSLLMCKLCGGMFTKQAALDRHYPVHFNNENALHNKEIADILNMQKRASGKSKSSKKGQSTKKESKSEVADKSKSSKKGKKTNKKKSKQKLLVPANTILTKPDKTNRKSPRNRKKALVTERLASASISTSPELPVESKPSVLQHEKAPRLDVTRNEQHSRNPDVLVTIKFDPITESNRESTQESTNNATEKGGNHGNEKVNDETEQVQVNPPSCTSIVQEGLNTLTMQAKKPS